METRQVERTCKQCGKKFSITVKRIYFHGKPHGFRGRTNYCSKECDSARLAEVAKFAKHEKAKPNAKCYVCGKRFHRYAGILKKNKRPCCSRKCYSKIKQQEMKGNKFGDGIKQTPERIAHRVSFIMGDKNPAWNGGVTFHKGRGHKKYKYIKCPQDLKEMANQDRKSTRLNSSHIQKSRMPASA